jgi:hypothetical protein
VNGTAVLLGVVVVMLAEVGAVVVRFRTVGVNVVGMEVEVILLLGVVGPSVVKLLDVGAAVVGVAVDVMFPEGVVVGADVVVLVGHVVVKDTVAAVLVKLPAGRSLIQRTMSPDGRLKPSERGLLVGP